MRKWRSGGGGHGPLWAAVSLLVVAIAGWPAPGWAQLEENYQEQQVQPAEQRQEAPQESVQEQLQHQPRVEVGWFEESVDMSEIERMDTAMNRLQGLVDHAAQGSAERANYMFRLAELFYRRSRFFEERAYDRRDRAFAARESNPAQSDQYNRAADDDLQQSDAAALQAINLYVDIYNNYHDSYPDMDGVLYYLGSTLSALGRLEDALPFFQELANDYPSSPYLPRALLAFGEYHFLVDGDMEQAQTFYHAVTQFPDSEVYPYAIYQEAWCFYNLGRYEEGLQRLLDAIAASTGDSAGKIRMRQRALNDLAMFYVAVGTPDNAFSFFQSVPDITDDQVVELIELVARLYGEQGHYSDSNDLYRALMAHRPNSFAVVHWQQEIVNNTRPGGNEEDIVREVRRWTELFNTARHFDDADPDAVAEAGHELEYQVRFLATTYHRDAQVTNNARLYALAYNLYSDYMASLADEWATTENQYTMSFYYAELLYRNERYEDAAEMWEHCLELDPNGEYTEEATYKAVLAYTRLVDMNGEMEVEHAQSPVDSQGTLVEGSAPQPRELPPVMQHLVQAADRYLQLNPPPEYAVEVEFAAARVLYEYAHLSEAAERFGHIATTYTEVDPERARVSAELLLDSLGALNDVEGMQHWVSVLQGTDLNRGQFAPRLNQLGTQISFGNCRQVQLDEQYQECGMCYFDFFRQYHDSDLVDRALYNSALCFEQADMIAQAIRVREYLIQYRPQSDLVPEMRYSLGQEFHRLALYRDASEYYEQYAHEHPDAEHASEALANAANFREGLGEYDEAVTDYQSFIDLFDHNSDLRDQVAGAFFAIGAIYEERGQTDQAIRQFRRYLDHHAEEGSPGLAIQAATRVGRLTWQSSSHDAEQWFVQALDTYNGLTDDQRSQLDGDSLDAAAEARFMLGELVYQQFTAVTIEGNETQVQDRLRQKLDLGRQAGDVYEQVRALQRPGWSIAAFTRLGQLYDEFYNAVINAPVPPHMSEEVEEAYRAMLVERSEEVKEQAITNYQTALEIARTAGWFNQYSELAERNLAHLDPSFRAGNEVRAEPVFEPASFYESPFVVTLEQENQGGQPPGEEQGPDENGQPPPSDGTTPPAQSTSSPADEGASAPAAGTSTEGHVSEAHP